MGTLRRRQGRLPPDLEQEIRRLAGEGRTPTEIETLLSGVKPWGRPLDIRTIRWRVKKYGLSADPSDPWSLAGAEAGEVALVLPVLAAVVAKTRGWRDRITQNEAEWIVRLRGAYPDLDPWEAFRLARLYVQRAEDGRETLDLDLFVACAAWRDSEAHMEYQRLWSLASSPKVRPAALRRLDDEGSQSHER